MAGAIAAALMAIALPSSATSDGEEAIVVDYAAAPSCPSGDQFLAQLRSFTPRWVLAPAGAEARRFVLRITRVDGRFVGTFDLRAASDGEVRREVRGQTCADVASGIAVAVALAIDARASTTDAPAATAPEPAPAPPEPAPGPPEPAPGPPDAAPAQPRTPNARPTRPPMEPAHRTFISVGARIDANGAVSVVLPTAAAFVDVAWHVPARSSLQFALRPTVRAGVRQSLTRTTSDGRSHVDITWRTGFLELCPAHLTLPAHVSLEGCLAANVGQLTAEALDVPSARASRLWIDSGAVLGARWQAHRHVFVSLSTGLWYPIIRDRIRVTSDRVASEAPPLGPSAGVGVGYRF